MVTIIRIMAASVVGRPPLRFSVVLFGHPPEQYAPLARAAENAGFEAIWLAEHLVTPLHFAKLYPYNDSGDPGYLPDTPLVDAWVTIGHLSAVTTSILLGTGVYILPLRNPFATARAVASAQALSRDRVLLGVGTGWMREEFDAVGAEWFGRGQRTDEAIAVMRGLWGGRPFTYHGLTYRFPQVQMSPPVAPPPVIVGGVSPSALDRAARLGDGWYGPSCSLEESARHRDSILTRLGHLGRDAQDFSFWARLNQPDRDQVERARQLGLDRLVVPVSHGLGSLEAKVDWVQAVAREVGLFTDAARDAGR